jgi:hypothetical protein
VFGVIQEMINSALAQLTMQQRFVVEKSVEKQN